MGRLTFVFKLDRREREQLIERIAEQTAERVSGDLSPTLNYLAEGIATLMSSTDEIASLAADISNQAQANADAVDQAVALLEELAVEDPRLSEVVDQLRSSSQTLNDNTTELAAATADAQPDQPGGGSGGSGGTGGTDGPPPVDPGTGGDTGTPGDPADPGDPVDPGTPAPGDTAPDGGTVTEGDTGMNPEVGPDGTPVVA